jgi:sterol desaturase/sphingolipid hydroxylase (fatty acid hydroxylase superfamily)
MKPEIIAVICVFITFSIIEMWRVGLFTKKHAVKGDGLVELISTLMLLVVTQPFILAATYYLGLTYLPQFENALAHWSISAQIAMLLVFDDMLQYWWHRLSHSTPWLYKLHRPHHNPGYMSVRLVYRNGLLYYMFMPAIWGSAVMSN